MKVLALNFLLIINVSIPLWGQGPLDEYMSKAQTVTSFDGYSFVSESFGEYHLKIGNEQLRINYADTIPLRVFNIFVDKILYPDGQAHPSMISVKGENRVDSIKVSNVGLMDKYKIASKKACAPKTNIIAKKQHGKRQIEFLLLTDTPEGVYVELYLYDVNKGRILSYIPLFRGEKIDKTNCNPLGRNRVAAYQTTEIKGGIITQLVNDSFNDIWTRRIKLNESGYYELIWWDNPLKETVIHKVQINDPDGFTNVRSMPSTKSQVLYKIMLNEKFQVEELPEAKEWYKIFQYNDKYEGWIHKSRVTRLP